MRIKYGLLLTLLLLIALAFQANALIQTDIVYSMDDTYVNSSSAATNYDNSGLIVDGSNTEVWFRFDLTDPSGYYVASAILWAYAASAAGNEQYNIHKADSATWTETNLTWNSKPDYGGSLDSEQIGTTGWYGWILTETYSSGFNDGSSHESYALEGSSTLVLEDKENTQGTGNVPYLNLTMMIPEVYLLSPDDGTSTYDTTQTFRYNTTDAGNITNCSLILDDTVNMTNTSLAGNTTSSFTPTPLFPGEHNWTVRCYDRNRQVYMIEPASRDITVLASVEWHSPGSATPLDIGTAVIGQAGTGGTRQVYSNNTNNNAEVSCASGDCGVVTTNWSTTGMSSGQAITAGFNCSTGAAGSFQADFELTSDQDATADILTVNCTILAPDLRINSTNITFSDDTPTENQEINITAGVYNDGNHDASSIVVRFYEGHHLAGQQIGIDHTIDLNAGASTSVVQNWTTRVGEHDIYVTVDPPVETNGSITESDESDNYAYSTIDIPLWTFYVGNVTGSIALETEDQRAIIKWNVTDTTSSNIYVTDTDSNPDFNSLKAFSRNTTGSYMSDDFTELDTELNTTGFGDSINLTYTSEGSPKDTRTFNIFGVDITDVPTVNSTDYTTFATGILWDSSDDSNSNNQYDNTSDEDIVFITMVNQSHTGRYGFYDYEIRVPARLKGYKGPDTQTVTFYTEIK